MRTILVNLSEEDVKAGVVLIINPTASVRRTEKQKKAVSELTNMLKQNGPLHSEDVFSMMAKMGFGAQMVYKAGREANVVKKVDFLAGIKRWYWCLPEDADGQKGGFQKNPTKHERFVAAIAAKVAEAEKRQQIVPSDSFVGIKP